MKRVRLAENGPLSIEQDRGRINALLAGSVCFLGLSILYYIDKKTDAHRPSLGPIPSEVSSTTMPKSLDARITVPTFSPEDQAILDALAEHHASTLGSIATESSVSTSVEETPLTTHEVHETETSLEDSPSSSPEVSVTTHGHDTTETTPAQPVTGTTVAHSDHPSTGTTVATPASADTTHGSSHVDTTIVQGPETVPSLPPKEDVTIPPPAG